MSYGNAAQIQMVKYGWMHNYLRMYWAKKIVEWTPNVDAAMKAAIYLNDKYELGRARSRRVCGHCVVDAG